MQEILIPKNNEQELYSEAVSQGKVPIFLYFNLDFKTLSLKLKKLEKFNKCKSGFLFSPESPGKLNLDKRIRKAVDYVVGTARDLKTIRALVEKGRIDFLVNIESSGGREHTHYRRSNFNQVIARICKEKNVTYLVDFSRIKSLEGIKRAVLLGRIMQNNKICKKEKVSVEVKSFAGKLDELVNSDCLSALHKIL